MTRIIAGTAGSLALDVPEAGTRPTSDRVRESLFGSLEASGAIDAARVLDLFAGSGALGLEAVSRGAMSADLVEISPRAAAVLQRNAAKVARAVGADRPLRVHRSSVDAYVRAARGDFDLVFIDPPYDVDEAALSTTLTLLVPLLSESALVVIERSSRSPQPVLPDGLTHVRSKKYGDTTLWWVVPADQPLAASQSR